MAKSTDDIDTMFIFNRATDETVDDEYVLISNPNFTIQCAPYAGGYGVNEHGGEGADFWVMDHGICRTLAAAKRKAVAMASKVNA